jgi:hypothetical protein
MESTTPTPSLLRDRLQDAFTHSAYQWALTESELRNLISVESVLGELERCLSSTPRDILRVYSKAVCTGTRPRHRIFAILTLIDKVRCIGAFLEEDVSDDDLPVIAVFDNGDTSEGLSSTTMIPTVLQPCFSDWYRRDTDQFQRTQWNFLATDLSPNISSHMIAVHPVIQDSEKPLDQIATYFQRHGMPASETVQGGYGIIHRVRIYRVRIPWKLSPNASLG